MRETCHGSQQPRARMASKNTMFFREILRGAAAEPVRAATADRIAVE